MGLFTTDYKDLDKNTLVPEGIYECIIDHTEPDATKSGAEYINIALRIRTDLDQAMPDTNGKQHNRLVFANIWRRKKTGEYDQSELSYVMKAAGVPEGVEVRDWNHWSQLLTGKPVRVKVAISKDEYNGRTTERNQIWPNSFAVTKYPLQVQSNPFSGNQGTEVLTNEDIPF
ncbi:DUF669 domain-containing protein [Lactobacillus gigeriorum]|uniref:DUF669 domain-containing protein n=1 Tax=Lactobacillus gigeriorum DSM 23908 = CRBIP 24.85 TaxID=1423751 RepID=I7K077_9LACO|nr:DUF669 domain-containing protein [Lactobacillus gigeriorum]KRN10132.1 hypothetical protein FC38_GL001196 [Lactobacillus gigeriorum DSM 23908 = CRBIP 24.85]CCI86700.1 Putative uncharacterized protein [Lactobacillus gigeriorum DSM 23908 = CRBIP 24.85]